MACVHSVALIPTIVGTDAGQYLLYRDLMNFNMIKKYFESLAINTRLPFILCENKYLGRYSHLNLPKIWRVTYNNEPNLTYSLVYNNIGIHIVTVN